MGKMTRRDFIRGVVAAGSAGALSAIGSKAPAQPKGITLRAMSYPYPVTNAIRDMLPAYEKQTGVKIEWDDAPQKEALTMQMTELVTKTGRYDIFITMNRWLPAEAATGGLLALDDLIAKKGTELDWQDFFPKQREMFSYQGKAYAIPLSANLMTTVYRKDVFDEEGIKVPPLGTSFTHDQWLSIVKRLTKGGKFGTSFLIGDGQGATQVWSVVMMSAGGRFFDEKLTPVFNSKEGLLAAEYLQELMRYAPPDMLTYFNTDTNEQMMRGRVLTQAPHWASRIPMLEDKKQSQVAGKVRWTTLPYAGWVPDIKVGLAHNDGWALGIPGATKYAREAFDFITWCVTKEKQTNQVTETMVPPSRTSVFDNSELQQKFVWMPVLKEQFKHTFNFPMIPEWEEILQKTGMELTRGWSGQSSLARALDRSNELVTQLLKERNYPVGSWKGAKLPWE